MMVGIQKMMITFVTRKQINTNKYKRFDNLISTKIGRDWLFHLIELLMEKQSVNKTKTSWWLRESLIRYLFCTRLSFGYQRLQCN